MAEVGRQFSEDPIINHASWGFIAGALDVLFRSAIGGHLEAASTKDSTEGASDTSLVTKAEKTDIENFSYTDTAAENTKKLGLTKKQKKEKKEKKQRNKERQQKRAERKARK